MPPPPPTARLRLALATLRYPDSPADAVARVERAIAQAGEARADLVVFPECYVPGYRGLGHAPPPPDPAYLEAAWAAVAAAARRAGVGVVLGTERLVQGALRATALVVRRDGAVAGWQDKVQLDPSEDGTYTPGDARQVFQDGPLTFGVVICHEGWRYPETVRWAAVRGARLVLHPFLDEAEPGGFRPQRWADPENTFHEKAILCRAAENGCWFASVNYASEGAPVATAVARPDGTLLAYQPYGAEGLLVAELDLAEANLRLAGRYRPM